MHVTTNICLDGAYETCVNKLSVDLRIASKLEAILEVPVNTLLFFVKC